MIFLNTFKKRIDELGRIVIPKQIRNSFKIKNFDELEMFLEKDSIIIKKCIGLEMYKSKLDLFLSFLEQVIDIKIIILEENNVISSNYKGIEYRNELILDNSGYMNTEKLRGYIEVLPIIVDSNTIGKICFVNKVKFEENKNLLKNIRDVIINFIF